ncbi:MAG: hypothetical protein EXR69_15210, partial [Myxococcales bacterium]|nr:hypothetical protein [Myxococcales bacterium]
MSLAGQSLRSSRSPSPEPPLPRLTAPDLVRRKQAAYTANDTGGRIAMMTAYDAQMARLVDMAGVDMVLVGDSLGMVVQGGSDTLSVTV